MRKSAGGFFSKLSSTQKSNRKSAGRLELGEKLSLEKVLGLTTTNRNGLTCNSVTGVIAYPAGCVIVLYDPKTNLQSHIFSPDKKTITCVAFSSDGKYLVSGETGQQPSVRVWELGETLLQVAELRGHKSGITSVEFSPNQKLLVSIGDQHDMLVNVWNWKLCQTVACNKSGCRVRALSFAENGNYFVTVGNRHVKFWYLDSDSSSGKANEPTIPISGRSGILGDQKNNVFTDVVCGRGRCSMYTYCITKSGLLCLFTEKRMMQKWVELEKGSTNCLVLTESFIFCGCSNGLIRVFEPTTLQFIATLPRPHPLGVNVSEAISPSDTIHNKICPDLVALTIDDIRKKLTTVYNDHSIYIWDIRDVRKVGKIASFLYHSACIWGVEMYPYYEDSNQSCLPSGSFLTCSTDDTIRIWNLDKGEVASRSASTKNYPRNLYSKELRKTVYIDAALSNLQDTSVVSYSKDSDVKNGIRCMQISPNGQVIATGDRSGCLRIYELQFFDELFHIEAHESEILCVEYSTPDSGYQLLASSSRDRLIHIFDVKKDYELLQTIDDHSSSITAVRFSYDSESLQLLSCGTDKVLMIHNAQVNEYGKLNFIRNTIVSGKATLYDMGIDPTKKLAATVGQDRFLRIYDIQSAKQVHHYKGSLSEEGNLIKLQLDGGGVYAAISCSDKTIGIYYFASGECEATVYGHSEIVTGLKFTTDGRNLISVSGDGCIFVWALPLEFTSNIRSHLHDLNISYPQNDEKDLRRETFVVLKSNSSLPEEQFPALEKLVEEDEPPKGIPGYRFSVGQLPVWAQKQMRPGNPGGPAKGSSQPLGRWGERTEGMMAVPDLLTGARLYSDDSTISAGSSERSCSIEMEDGMISEIIYPPSSEEGLMDRNFPVTESRKGRSKRQGVELNKTYSTDSNGTEIFSDGAEEDFSDSEQVSDCFSGSPGGSDQESDFDGSSSPLMEHFERLGTPSETMETTTKTAKHHELTTPNIQRNRNMSISAKFLSDTFRRGSNASPMNREEQKKSMDALKAKFKLHANSKKNKSKNTDKKDRLSRHHSFTPQDDQSRGRTLSGIAKDNLVSRSCQSLSTVGEMQDSDRKLSKNANFKFSPFNSIASISNHNGRKSSTPIFSKVVKQEKKLRRYTDIPSWSSTNDLGTQKSKFRRDSLKSEPLSFQNPMKTMSPIVTRRRKSHDQTSLTKSVPNGSSSVVWRNKRNNAPRPQSMIVTSQTKKELEKEIFEGVSYSDDENDNLLSKVKHVLERNSYNPSAFTDKKRHSLSLSQEVTQSSLNASQTNRLSNSQPLQEYNSSHSSQENRHSHHAPPPHEDDPSLCSGKREIDIDELGNIHITNSNYIAEQQAENLQRVSEELENVMKMHKIQNERGEREERDVLYPMRDRNDANYNENVSNTPPERDIPLNTDMETTEEVANEPELSDELQPSDDSAPLNECQEIMNNFVQSYNEVAEYHSKILDQPQSDIQAQLLGVISRTYLDIENSIREQREVIDKSIEMNKDSSRFKEFRDCFTKVISSDISKDEGTTMQMISLLDKYSNALIEMVARKNTNRETLIE